MGTPNFSAANPLQNQALNSMMDRMTNGKEMRRLIVEREALLVSLRATGLAQPATILNFNPVPLSLDGAIGFKVPSVIDEAIPDEARLNYEHEGRKYKATVLTIREPKTYTQIKDVKEDDGVPSGVYDLKACKQIEIAHCFYVAYTLGMLGSAVGMGGVIAFEGDRRSLERVGNKRISIKVPDFIRLPNKTREYITQVKDFEDCVAACLKLQRAYCNRQTQEAQAYWDQEDQRGNITPVHRIWHQYEIDMGWRETPAPWITLTNVNPETCAGCGNAKKRAEAYFCWNCQRPYQPFKAYVDGELGVEHPSLNKCTPEEWAQIRKIEAQRKKLREGLS
jgi:hypothetical protein